MCCIFITYVIDNNLLMIFFAQFHLKLSRHILIMKQCQVNSSAFVCWIYSSTFWFRACLKHASEEVFSTLSPGYIRKYRLQDRGWKTTKYHRLVYKIFHEIWNDQRLVSKIGLTVTILNLFYVQFNVQFNSKFNRYINLRDTAHTCTS